MQDAMVFQYILKDLGQANIKIVGIVKTVWRPDEIKISLTELFYVFKNLIK